MRNLPLSLSRASELPTCCPSSRGFSREVLCDGKLLQGYHWLERFPTDQSKLMGVAPHCPGVLYIAARSPGVGHCWYNMAEASEEVLGSNSDTEAEVEREARKIKKRVTAITENMKTPCQPKDKEREKVRLPYSCLSSSPSIPHPRHLSCPYLAQNSSSVCTHSFKVPPPIYFHPLPQNQCLFWAHFVFLPGAEDTLKG